jgi:hypothetical protein
MALGQHEEIRATQVSVKILKHKDKRMWIVESRKQVINGAKINKPSGIFMNSETIAFTVMLPPNEINKYEVESCTLG